MSTAPRAHVSIVWDLAERDPAAMRRLARREPWIDRELARVRSAGIPFAETTSPFRGARYVRPALHRRAFYLVGPSNGVIAFKGTEVLSRDVPRALRDMAHAHAPLAYSTLEMLPLAEQKVPMAVTLDEALADATKAFELQTAYFRRYRTLARVPLPLMVLRFADPIAERFLREVRPHLSARASSVVQRLAREGFGAYLYYYPNPPIRVQHASERIPPVDAGYRARKVQLEARTHVHATVQSWVRLFVRMLGLGFFPCSLSHDSIGQCVREQNAVLDGGFVDVDSLCRFDEVSDERAFFETLLVSIVELVEMVHTFVLGHPAPRRGHQRGYTATMLVVSRMVHGEVLRAMRREEASGVVFDRRVASVLGDDAAFAGGERMLDLLYPARDVAPPKRAR